MISDAKIVRIAYLAHCQINTLFCFFLQALRRREAALVLLITLATNIIGIWFLMRRRAWWGDLKIFFATLLGIMHRVAGRVSVSLRQLFLKRFLKIMESGLEPMREKSGPSGDRTHPGVTNPYYTVV